MQISRAFPAFSAAAAIAYLASMALHPAFTLFTYAPRLGGWYAGVPALAPRDAPGMYWYSWLATAFIAGLAAGAVALVLPEKMRKSTWSGISWVIPLVLTLVLAYLERTWFGFR